MTTPHELAPESNFIRSRLPWLIAAGALVVYALTLNHWVSFSNATNVARMSGVSWSAELHGPVYFLVTLPLRWLPLKYLPLALNLFSMLCAVLTLALLARTVALLPHNRTEAQRQREHSEFSFLSIREAWIPPLLAAAVCGLQLTFWEHATATSSEAATMWSPTGSDEMFSLLLFAYVVRNLMEFRASRNDSWLMRAALVWCAGMANSWILFCLFPAFLISLIWL